MEVLCWKGSAIADIGEAHALSPRAMAADPWLDSLREEPAPIKSLHQAEARYREAATAFKQLSGEKVLGIAVQ